MKIEQPSREVEVCDFCHRESYLQTCDVCGRQYCLIDNGTVAQSWGFLDICRDCAHRDDVKDICHRYAKQLTPIFRRRNAALKRLKKEES